MEISLKKKKVYFPFNFFQDFFKGSLLIQALVTKVTSPLFIPYRICSDKSGGKV